MMIREGALSSFMLGGAGLLYDAIVRGDRWARLTNSRANARMLEKERDRPRYWPRCVDGR